MADVTLYRHFSADGTLLYVGVAAVGFRRQAIHLGNSKWADEIAIMTFTKYPRRSEALRAESVAIAEEKPLYNIVGISKADKYRSVRASPTVMRLPEALLRGVDRIALEEKTNRTQAAILLMESALIAREK